MDVDADFSAAGQPEESVGDALGGFAGVIAGEHPVDIGPVKGPSATARMQAQDIDRWNNQYSGGEFLTG